MFLEFWFPTPIWSCVLEYDCNIITNYALDLYAKDPEGRQASNVNGWQSKDLYYDDSQIKDFLDILNIKLEECIFEYNYDIKGIKIGNYWLNINKKGSYNTSHTHPGSVLSGVYYSKAPPNSGNIVFENDSKNNFILQTYKTAGDSVLSHSQCHYPPKDGKLIIFPSHLSHLVTQSNSDEDRISLSFNSKVIE